jgi:hypothetical protein
MSRGGKRDNAGRKSGWVNLETKLIRVPVAIESQLMAIAKKLDQGEIIDLETKSIEVESVTESNLDSITDSIKEIVDRYRKESDAKSLTKTTRWDAARKLLKELESVLYGENVLDLVTESNLKENELVTQSNTTNNETVADSKTYGVEQFELIPPTILQKKLEPLTQRKLASRFGVDHTAVGRKKQVLPEWSKSKDPDGIAWEYREETRLYHPLN